MLQALQLKVVFRQAFGLPQDLEQLGGLFLQALQVLDPFVLRLLRHQVLSLFALFEGLGQEEGLFVAEVLMIGKGLEVYGRMLELLP